jgi:hypothetical protein
VRHGSNLVSAGRGRRGYRFESGKFGVVGMTPIASETVAAPRVQFEEKLVRVNAVMAGDYDNASCRYYGLALEIAPSKPAEIFESQCRAPDVWARLATLQATRRLRACAIGVGDDFTRRRRQRGLTLSSVLLRVAELRSCAELEQREEFGTQPVSTFRRNRMKSKKQMHSGTPGLKEPATNYVPATL